MMAHKLGALRWGGAHRVWARPVGYVSESAKAARDFFVTCEADWCGRSFSQPSATIEKRVAAMKELFKRLGE